MTYSARNSLLKSYGFNSYAEYLASNLWNEIRHLAFEVQGKKCKICHGEAQIIHHLSYEEDVLLGSDLTKLIPLCHRYHKEVELKKDGRKRSLIEAIKQYHKMLRIRQPRKVGSSWTSVDPLKSRFVKCERCLKNLRPGHFNLKCKKCRSIYERSKKDLKKLKSKARHDHLLKTQSCKRCGNLAKRGHELCGKCKSEGCNMDGQNCFRPHETLGK